MAYIPFGMNSVVTLAPPAVKGRPREFDCEIALAAALRVFWRHGYEGASMSMLTEEMGITKPSLYAAFGNKEALFRKALDLYEREKLAYVSKALEAPTSHGVAERLLMGALAMQSDSCDPKGCMALASVACSPEAESIRAELMARRASSAAALIRRLEQACEDGDLPVEMAPEGLARYLLAIIQGLSVQAASGATCAELRGLVDIALRLWPGK